jgi:hypothetical protein
MRQLKRWQWLCYHFIWQLLSVTSYRSVTLYTWSFTGHIPHCLSKSVWVILQLLWPFRMIHVCSTATTRSVMYIPPTIYKYVKSFWATGAILWHQENMQKTLSVLHPCKTNVVHKNLQHKSWSKTTLWTGMHTKKQSPNSHNLVVKLGHN